MIENTILPARKYVQHYFEHPDAYVRYKDLEAELKLAEEIIGSITANPALWKEVRTASMDVLDCIEEGKYGDTARLFSDGLDEAKFIDEEEKIKAKRIFWSMIDPDIYVHLKKAAKQGTL